MRRTPLLVCAAAWLFMLDLAWGQSSSVDPKKLDALIEQLGSADYTEREAAQQAIEELGFEAFDALSAAEQGDDPEVAARARYLVRRMQVEWASSTDSDEVRQILNGYSQGDDRARRVAIDALAKLPNAEGLPALARLVRFESSPLRSKQAGLRAVEGLLKRRTIDDDVAQMVNRTLGQSTRPGAQWLRAALERSADPSAAVQTWVQLVGEEQGTFRAFPQRSHVEIIRTMIRVQADWLLDLDRREEADKAMRQLVLLDPGTSLSLRDLVKWFAERRAWNMLDEVEGRFGERVERDPVLLYHFAQARGKQGETARADEIAAKALAASGDDPARHAQVGRELNLLGMRRYATAEFQKVIDTGPPESPGVLTARILVAEALYDRGDSQAAADCLRACLDALKAAPQQARVAETLLRDPPSMKARMLFFEATAVKNDPAKQLEKLLAAIDADNTDLDVLIALHRHPDVPTDQRQRIRGFIAAAADLQRMMIRDTSRDPVPYNQLAWLLANTDGDVKEALACSQRSLELQPDDAGYLDTLAHCYFAAGEVDKAVSTEERAVEGDPESGLMIRALERFRAARDAAEDKPAS